MFKFGKPFSGKDHWDIIVIVGVIYCSLKIALGDIITKDPQAIFMFIGLIAGAFIVDFLSPYIKN